MKKELIKKRILILIVAMIIFILSGTKNIHAETLEEIEEEEVLVNEEYTEEYKRWLELSDEEKEYYLEPEKYGAPYYETPVVNKIARIFTGKAVKALIPRFDLRETIPLVVKNQNPNGNCWAYAGVTVLESNLTLTDKNHKLSDLFSPRHMEYATSRTFKDGINENGYNREINSGGSNITAFSYYTSGFGPVLEETKPSTNANGTTIVNGAENLSYIEAEPVKKIEKYTRFPSIYKKLKNDEVIYVDSKDNILSETQVNEIRQQIKEHIMNYGGVSAVYYQSGLYSNYNQTAYYCNDYEAITNHVVTIIGWDDDYDVGNFNSNCKPENNGAWLIQNSWGQGQNDSGYFWISYEDALIECSIAGINEVSEIDYNNLYQHDILGYNYTFTFGTKAVEATEDTPEVKESLVKNGYLADVFTKKDNSLEILSEVAVTAVEDATVDIYVDNTGSVNINSATLVKSGVKLSSGYTTIDIDDIELPNEKFTVLVRYTSDEARIFNVPLEAYAEGSWETAKSNDGEGFYSYSGTPGTWRDINTVRENSSLCIKAFTSVGDTSAPTIKFETNGNRTPATIQKTKVTVEDESGIDPESLKYVWSTDNTKQPKDDLFVNSFENNEEISAEGITEAKYYLWVKASDIYGNIRYQVSNLFRLDNTKPTTPTASAMYKTDEGKAKTVKNDVYINKDVSVSFMGSKCMDMAGGNSGPCTYEYTLDNGETWLSGKSYTFSEDGIYTMAARATGQYTGIVSEESNTFIVKIDKQVPPAPTMEATVANGGYTNQDVTIQISGGETPSGVAKYQYNIKTEKYKTNNQNTQGEGTAEETTDEEEWLDLAVGEEIILTEPGIHTIKVRSVNNAGTIGQASEEYNIHIEKEQANIEFNPNGNETSATMHETTVTATDILNIVTLKYTWSEKSTGVKKEEITQDFINEAKITQENVKGNWYLWILAEDEAGNQTITRSNKFVFDSEEEKEDPDPEQKPDPDNNPDNKPDENPDQDPDNNPDPQPQFATITFTPNKNEEYAKAQKATVTVTSSGEITNIKYLWSQKEQGITKAEILTDTANGETIIKDTESGIWYLWVLVEDNTGFEKIERSGQFNLDNDNPIIENLENNKTYEEDVKLEIKDQTSKVSVEIIKDEKPYTYKEGEALTENGQYEVTATDEAGNTTKITFTIKRQEKPTIDFEPKENKTYQKEQSTRILVQNISLENIKSLKYLWSQSLTMPKEEDFEETCENGDVITNNTETGKFYLWICIEDINGNKTLVSSDEFYLDNKQPTNPTISANIDNGGVTKGKVTIKVEGGKAESKTHYEYSLDGGKTWTKVEGDTIEIDKKGTIKVLIATVGETGIRSEAEEYTFTIEETVVEENKNPNIPSFSTGINPYRLEIFTCVILGIIILAIVIFKEKENQEE